MQNVKIPTLPYHIAIMAILMIFPLVLTGYILLFPFSSEAQSTSNVIGLVLVGLAFIFSVAILFLIAMRREIMIVDNYLLLKHTFYSIKVDKSKIKSLSLEVRNNVPTDFISLKINGIAAAGFYSGWFLNSVGKKIFCAVSKKPVCRIEIFDDDGFSEVIFSCPENSFAEIRQWHDMLAS